MCARILKTRTFSLKVKKTLLLSSTCADWIPKYFYKDIIIINIRVVNIKQNVYT